MTETPHGDAELSSIMLSGRPVTAIAKGPSTKCVSTVLRNRNDASAPLPAEESPYNNFSSKMRNSIICNGCCSSYCPAQPTQCLNPIALSKVTPHNLSKLLVSETVRGLVRFYPVKAMVLFSGMCCRVSGRRHSAKTSENIWNLRILKGPQPMSTCFSAEIGFK